MLGRYMRVADGLGEDRPPRPVRDFRTVKRFKLDGAEGVLSQVGQGNEYPEAALTDAAYSYSVAKYGRRIPFLWEALVNDDLDALRDTPDRLAKAARMTEERFATEVYVDSTGPDATFFAGPATATSAPPPALPVAGDAAGPPWLRSGRRRTPTATRSSPGSCVWSVPPQLAVTGENILNATEIRNAPGATSGDQIT
jgi:hypothetical protein